MQRNGYSLTIAASGSGLSVAVYSEDGTRMAGTNRTFETVSGGLSGVDADELFASALTLADAVIRRSGLHPRDVARVGVVAPADAVVAWDGASGQPAGPVAVLSGGGASANRTGGFLRSALQDAKNGSGRLKVGGLDSWIVWNLSQGASFSLDPGHDLASAWDAGLGRYDEAWLREYGIPLPSLPEVLPSVGRRTDVSGVFLDGARPTIVASARTEIAAAFAALLGRGDELFVRTDSAAYALMRTRGDSPVGGTLFMHAGGELERGFLWRFHAPEEAAGWLRRIAEHEPGVVPLEVIQEEEVLVTRNAAHPGRADIHGISSSTPVQAIHRAALRSIAFTVREMIEEAALSFRVFPALIRTQMPLPDRLPLLPFLASVTGLPVRAHELDCESLGAMLLTGLGGGLWNSEEMFSVADRISASRVYEPTVLDARVSEEWEMWKRASARLSLPGANAVYE